MRIELTLLALAALLGLVQIIVAATARALQRGYGWAAGPRDEEGAPVGPICQRLARAQTNFLETFPIFAALVLAVIVAGRADGTSALGAWLYLVARVIYVPLYVSGVPVVRSCVWVVSVVGILMELSVLL